MTDSNWKKKGNKNSNNKNYNVLKRLGIFVTSYFSAAEHKRVYMITKIFQPTGYDEFENCHYRRTCLYSYKSQHSKHAAYKGSSSKRTHRHARIRVKNSFNWLCDKIKYLNRINLHCSLLCSNWQSVSYVSLPPWYHILLLFFFAGFGLKTRLLLLVQKLRCKCIMPLIKTTRKQFKSCGFYA